MAKKKFYAVCNGRGRVPEIYLSWEKCREMVYGCKNADYKSFTDAGDAMEYIRQKLDISCGEMREKFPWLPHEALAGRTGSLFREECSREKENGINVYVDGSFFADKGNYSYGIVFEKDGEVIHEENGIGKNGEAVSMRNVAGEIAGAMKAVLLAEKMGEKAVNIFYDYKGIEEWARGTWKRNNVHTRAYHEFMQEHMKKIKIRFNKVEAHTGDTFNERADRLAKEALS